MMNQIETLSDVEKWVFNFITAIRKDKFTGFNRRHWLQRYILKQLSWKKRKSKYE